MPVRLSNELHVGYVDSAAQRIVEGPQVLQETLSELARRHRVPGAQLAIHDGSETIAIEVGEFEYERGRLITQYAAFPIGSISKTFTATVAMILVADGD